MSTRRADGNATQRKLTREKVGPSKRKLLAVYLAREGWVATIQQGCIIERHIVAKTANNAEREAEAKREANRLLKGGTR